MAGYGIVKREKHLTAKDLPKQASYVAGMKGVFIGDSLIEVNGRTSKGLLASLQEQLDITTVNKGTSGYGWSTKIFSEMLIDKSADDANFIYIALGINDWWNVSKWGLSLGQVQGYIKGYLKYFHSIYPNKPIIVATPMPTIMTNGDAVGAGGYTLTQLVNVIKSEAKAVNAFILDMYKVDPLDVKSVTEAEKNAFLKKYFTRNNNMDSDGVHPNDAGWAIISKVVADYINNVMLVFADREKTDKYYVETTQDGINHLEITTFPYKEGGYWRIYPGILDSTIYNKMNGATELKITIGDTVLTDASVKAMGGTGAYNGFMFWGNKQDSEYVQKLFGGDVIGQNSTKTRDYYEPVKMIVEYKPKGA